MKINNCIFRCKYVFICDFYDHYLYYRSHNQYNFFLLATQIANKYFYHAERGVNNEK